MASVVNTNEASFQEEVLEAKVPVLVDFWAPWCGYCTRLAPVLDELAGEVGEKIKIVKVNVDENRALAQRYGVMSLPTMIVFKGSEQVEKIMGFMPKANISAKLSPHI
ncbi:MAG TPA: thioredoxin [Methylomusa anaerophila]|uniref:Thioredoxin n=1 Tax=Methylomusa anaerophila TaxID=1930071 RepID=A0A348AQC9_9FIRM|nr:thioredoxin [Methylomusa anaerophila]BBB93277.1 thioredoxin-1 [Methylomusa anaerophila]HML86892.1 thioredoxin [Methylomusa anaerophila]